MRTRKDENFGAAVVSPSGPAGVAGYSALAPSAAVFGAPCKWEADVLLVVIVGGAVGLFRTLLF